MSTPAVVIIGAGPAGLTAALELVRAGVRPIVIEADNQVGGISKTINHNGNRMDLGGHRFFSKSDWVMNWWQDILPIDPASESELQLTYQNKSTSFRPERPGTSHDSERILLVRRRLSRIYYLRRFFDYPVKLNFNTMRNLGVRRLTKIAWHYGLASVAPVQPELTLEDFLINRFGRELYLTFFKDYTEKVWGVPCARISAEWGAQRIKGLSVTRAVLHAVRQVASRGKQADDVETSLIEQFLYPRLGPGQLWEVVAEKVEQQGGEILLNHRVERIHRKDFAVRSVEIVNVESGERQELECSHLVSSMPVCDLAKCITPAAPSVVAEVAGALPYRDFLTAGLLVPRMFLPGNRPGTPAVGMPPDNWIYVQEPDVRLGRLQIFNNWSPDMVADHPKIFLGLEYFCNEGDDLWRMPQERFLSFAASELEKIGLIRAGEVESGLMVRVPKAYPAYFGAYDRMEELRDYFTRFSNLYLVGRNGMHRYNNQDHSMLSARLAVDCILDPNVDKSGIWKINVEQEYHEEN
jgi:protoporphyrinogen oxidase